MAPITVTAANASSRLALTVRVLTGAAASQPGATATNSTGDTPITPAATGSLVYGMLYWISSSGGPFTDPYSAATTLLLDSWSSPAEAISFVSSSPTTAATPVTLGCNPAEGSNAAIGLCEILASGTLAEDASTPPPLPGSSLATVSSLTTASFSPPAGALLVALAGANNTSGISVSDSSGLTWTQQVNVPLGGFNVRIWTAQVPGGSTPVSQADVAAGTEALSVSGPVYHPGALSRFVVDAPAAVPWPVLPAGTTATPVPLEPGTGGAAGYGSTATAAGQGAGYFGQSLVPGQVLLLDPAGPVYAAIAAVVNLRPYVQGTDDAGHAAISN